ncbi:MAG: sensor histidine kinase [Flavobacteriales bacterium]|nr:sensor histidine kinase [Flavobacteriales bacterium]
MSRPHLALALLLSTTALCVTRASNVGDSLRYVLDADATLTERSLALVKIARRSLQHDPTAALAHAMNALRFAEQSGDQRIEHDALAMQGEVQLRLGLYPEHLRTTMRALEIAQVLADASRIGSDLQALSTAYRTNSRMDKSVEEARNALAVILSTKDKAAIQQAERFLMNALLQAGRFDEVMKVAERALTHCNAPADSVEKARVRLLMARSSMAQGDFNNALPYLTMASRVLGTDGTPTERFELLLDQANAALGMGRAQEARTDVHAAAALLPQVDSPDNRAALLHLQYRTAATGKEWENALVHLRAYHAMIDSVQATGLDLTLAGMQVMYDLERKDKDNWELRDQNARNEATIAEQRVSNLYLMGAAALFLLLAMALFFTSRNSVRTARRSRLKNAVIERQKDEIHAKNLELQRQNMRLAESLMSEEQKDIVIKEIHHRVKNNLQVVDSLLNMQCGGLQDPATAKLLKEAQGRIRAMSMVHGSIYRSGGEERIPVKGHLEDLARNVLAAHGRHDSISVLVDVAHVNLSAQDLMPLSLVVNELLTNAIKYAFAERGFGSVRIVLRPSGNGYELLFSDDGGGSGEQGAYLREGSFGLQLIDALAQQLNGRMRMLKGAGTTFCLTFFPEGMEQRKAS